MKIQRRTDTTFACPLVGRRDLERRQMMHREKVQRMTSAIDTRPPPAQPHLTLYGRDYVSKKRATTEAAFSDLKMIQAIAKTMTRKMEVPVRKGPVSLNADSRKQEIYRVMSENHRLLDRLETLEPVVSTQDLVRDYQWKRRYTVGSSHTKRLAGEYDSEVIRHQTEDKARMDQLNRSVQMRLSKGRERQMMSGSMSSPSLSMTAPEMTNRAAASPERTNVKPAPKRISQDLAGSSGSSSTPLRRQPSSSSVGMPQKGSKEKQQMEKLPPESVDRNASEASPKQRSGSTRVSFQELDSPTSPQPVRNFKKGVPTPHPKRSGSRLFEDSVEEEEEEVAVEADKPALDQTRKPPSAPPTPGSAKGSASAPPTPGSAKASVSAPPTPGSAKPSASAPPTPGSAKASVSAETDSVAKDVPPSSEAPPTSAPLTDTLAEAAASASVAEAAPAEASPGTPSAQASAPVSPAAAAAAAAAPSEAAAAEAPPAEASPGEAPLAEAKPAEAVAPGAATEAKPTEETETDEDGFEKEDPSASGYEQEFDPSSSSFEGESATAAPAAASAGPSPKVGVAPTPGTEERDAYEEEYEDDFADDTLASPTAGNLSKAMGNSKGFESDSGFEESGAFEASKDDSFEGSKDG